jgi:hypothetical protein
LVDFGTAKTRYLRAAGGPDGKRSSVYGTVGYAAPELYRGHSEPRSDVYSLAATAYHLLTDDDPRDHPARYPQLGSLSPDLSEILERALAEEIENRPSATQFREQLHSYLAGQTMPLRALTFPDGDTADDRGELLALSVKYWNYAASILQDGTIAHWLRQRLHDPVAAQAAEAAVRQWPADADAALDTFIRLLDPAALPPGKMELQTTSLRLLQAAPATNISRAIKVSNAGQGYLRGKISSTQPWVKTGTTFSCPPGRTCTLPIEIDTTGLVPGQPLLAAVTLSPAGGVPDVVGVQVLVAGTSQAQEPPAIRVRPDRVDFKAAADDFSISSNVVVTNVSLSKASVRAQSTPAWLLVQPEVFSLAAGAKKTIKLIVRVDKVQDRKQKVKLTFALDGGHDQEIEVRLQLKRRGLFG